MVTDVGRYYVNTTRLASIIWAWATAYDASPDLYKIDVGVPGGPGSEHLHARWKRYCDGGLRFLREASDWFLAGGGGTAGKKVELVYGLRDRLRDRGLALHGRRWAAATAGSIPGGSART